MPVMNGKQLVSELKKTCPDLPVIYMSGHAEDVLTRQGMLDPSLELLSKPFLPNTLTNKAREVLDRAHCS